jgi:EEF1A lysine methyltransferase 4
MVQYGSIEYWNHRYHKEEDNPFDWLVDYREVHDILTQLLPDDKSLPILLPGCGNAEFSPDLYRTGGYQNQLNIDLSEVVIEQMRKKYPNQGMQWKVMDVLHLDLADGSYPVIIDKSLIDTMMCYADG